MEWDADVKQYFNDFRHDLGVNEEIAAQLCLAKAIYGVAYQLRELGRGDGFDNMGAIEVLANQIKEGFESITNAVDDATKNFIWALSSKKADASGR